MASVLIRRGTIVTMNDDWEVREQALSIRDGRTAALGPEDRLGPHDAILDAPSSLVLPGFVQTHLHLCQTLFRGFADDLPLLDWLRRRIWPMEAAIWPAPAWRAPISAPPIASG
jgi:5-methylthioadenosine/S-adenosylhomocysteine deaminase